MRRSWLLLALLGCAPASAGVDVGVVDRGMLDATPDFGPAPAHDAAVGDLAGDHWDGTIDGDPFPSGSHRVQIILDHASGDGPRTGVIVFGMAAAPPPATDPSVGYPRGFDFHTELGVRITATEGFVYPIVTGTSAGAHLDVSANGLGLWERWCELEAPVPLGPGETGFGCLPAGGGSQSSDDCIYEPADGPAYPIDCGRMTLCQPPGFCECTESGCVARVLAPFEFELDVSADGTSATGTVTLAPTRNVQLTRM